MKLNILLLLLTLVSFDAKASLSDPSTPIPIVEEGAGMLSSEKGLKFASVLPGCVFDRLGFQKDDILVSINGISTRNPEDFFQALPELSKASEWQVIRIRNHKVQDLTFKVE